MALLGRLIGICLLPLIFFMAFEQGFGLSNFFVSVCRYMASTRMLRALLCACFDYIRDSQECDIVCSYPGSPLILATLLERDIPTDDSHLEEFRAELKEYFYYHQWRAGRISFAQRLTFLNRPNATWYHEKEDNDFAERYQAARAAYEEPQSLETTREWVRRMRKEREAADDKQQQCNGASDACHPRTGRSLQPYQGNPHAQALALLSDTPPEAPPKFKKLRGLAPRDSRGNIAWGRDPVYEAYLIEEARAKPTPTGVAYRRLDSFTLTINEKIKFKSLQISDKLNLGTYSVRHWCEHVFQIQPPDNRSMFFDMLDRSYHEMWEWDYENNLPLWRIVNAINAKTTSVVDQSRGFGPKWSVPTNTSSLFGNNTSGGSTGFGGPSQPTTGSGTSTPFANNTHASNTGGISGKGSAAPAPAPGQPGSLFGKPASNTGSNAGARLFPNPPPNTATSNNSATSNNNHPATSHGAQSQTFSDDNVLVTLSGPEAHHAKIEEWISNIKDTLEDITYDSMKGRLNDPGDAWTASCESAERWLRWIAEFASDANGNWNGSVLSVAKAKKMGVKSKWWKTLGSELKRIHEDPQTRADSPLARLFVQFWKVHNMCRETFGAP